MQCKKCNGYLFLEQDEYDGLVKECLQCGRRHDVLGSLTSRDSRARVSNRDNIYPKDTGCDKAKLLGYGGKCVECPFKKCLEDMTRGELEKIKSNRKRGVKNV